MIAAKEEKQLSCASELQDALEAIRKLRANLEEATKSNQEMIHKNKTLQEEVQMLKETNDKVSIHADKMIKEERETNSGIVQELLQKEQQLSRQVEAAKRDKDEWNNRLRHFQAELKKTQVSEGTLKSQVQNLQQLLLKQQTAGKEKEQVMADKEKNIKDLEQNVVQQQEELRMLNEEKKRLQQLNSDTSDSLSNLKAENKALLNAAQNLREELKREKYSLDEKQCQLSETVAELSSLHGTHQQLQKEFSREKELLLQQLSEAKAEVASLQNAQKESIAFGIEPWKVSRDTVKLERNIGVGGWGVVYEGKLTVAVKQFHTRILSERNVLRLKREMRMLALVRHPNLLQFIAAVFDDGGNHRRNPPYIITELLDGSLRSTYEDQALPKSSLLAIFQDTARALDYLHRRYEPIIHRDVSSANVLLKQLSDDKWIAKLSDLGSANLAKEAYTMNEGARVYCAPEAFTFDTDARSTGTLTPAVDIYSYGIMLCEVATRTFPSKDEYPKILDRLRRQWPRLHQLVLSCTKPSPEQRPPMEAVLSQLEGFPPQR